MADQTNTLVNGWGKFGHHVLKELERLADNDEAFDGKLDRIRDQILMVLNKTDRKVDLLGNDVGHLTLGINEKIRLEVKRQLNEKLFKKAVSEANVQGKWKFRASLATGILALFGILMQFLFGGGIPIAN